MCPYSGVYALKGIGSSCGFTESAHVRVAFVAIDDPNRMASWSGIPFHTLKELQRRFDDLHVIDTPVMDSILRSTGSEVRLGVLLNRSRLISHIFQQIIDAKLSRIQPDVIVSVGAAHKVSRVSGHIPLVHVTDALYPTIIGYYDKYKNLSQRSKKIGNLLQNDLVRRSSAIVLASEWAAQCAATLYPCASPYISVVPFGANLSPSLWEDSSTCGDGPLKLLFVGFDWERKGGGLVLETFRLIKSHLPDTELHIVGCTPREARLPGVFVHGVLRKDHPQERQMLETIFHQSNFFFMPSKQEAYGIAYCEAFAFGLPAVAALTGGVTTIIQDGVTGILIDGAASPAIFASRIEECWSRPEQYRAMQLAARRDFELRLNWRAWGEKIEAILRRTMQAEAQ